MKTHELADQLELLAKFLRAQPNEETILTFDNLLRSGEDKTKASSAHITESANPTKINELEEKIKNMSPSDIEEVLESDKNIYTTAYLKDLASRLGVPVSQRQSRQALINQIARHQEASKMDDIIRNAKQDS